MRSLHISLNTTHSGCKPSSSISSLTSHILSCPYPHISLLPPPHSYRPTSNHLYSYAPHAQTISIYHASPPQPHSEPSNDYTNPHCAFYPSAIPHTSISPSSAPFSPDFADLLSSSPRFLNKWNFSQFSQFPSSDYFLKTKWRDSRNEKI